MANSAAINEFLQEQGIKVTDILLKALDDLGVDEISDLSVLREDDFKNTGMSILVPDYSYIFLAQFIEIIRFQCFD